MSMFEGADRDSYAAMLEAVRAFHHKHDFARNGGERMAYRVALMAEELGEISAAVTKGKPIEELAEECADLLILLIGNAVAAEFDLAGAFWTKMDELMLRPSRIIDGAVRVSRFSGVDDPDPVD